MPAPGGIPANNMAPPGGSTGGSGSGLNPSPGPSTISQPTAQPRGPSESSSQQATSANSSTVTTSKEKCNNVKAVVIEKPEVVCEASIEPVKEEKTPLILERPKRISFSKSVDGDLTPKANGAQLPKANPVPSSPGTPCSQCLREQSNGHGTCSGKLPVLPPPPSSVSPTGQNGGQEFFGSSEECCSSWSGCCNSSCDGEQQSQQRSQQQPLSVVVMQQQQQQDHVKNAANLTNKLSVSTGGDMDFPASEVPKVATISCPQFEGRLSKMSRSVPEIPGEIADNGSNQRHLVTFVTPSMETIPLEMCQDIPDVLI